MSPPDFISELSLTAEEYAALSGKDWGIDVYLSQQKKPTEGLLVIPQGFNDADGLNTLAWLWIYSPHQSILKNSKLTIRFIDELFSMSDIEATLPEAIKQKKYSITICDIEPY